MTEEKKQSESTTLVDENEDEIDLLELAKKIWKDRKLIIYIVVIVTFVTAVISLFMTNIYTAQAVLKPVSQNQGGGKLTSLASQFGGIASLAGITMPSSASTTEMVNLLNSNLLRKTIIETHNLLPVLFPDQWDKEKKTWKEPGIIIRQIGCLKKLLLTQPIAGKKETNYPDIWDGIRKLDDIINIKYDSKDDIITISADFSDPDMSARIVNYFVIALNEHMSGEAKRIANINKEYLEKQLRESNDPLIQQKIYNLIAEKIETIMMAEVKEGFAFKTLDPPMAPDKKSKPKRALIVILAFIVSLFFAIFTVLLKDYFRKIKSKSAGGQNVH